jgi:pimeloyl-ACP methyl ester carboxylesterase
MAFEFAISAFMAMVETKFVTSGGLRLWTERSGAPEDPAVLLVMGTSAPAIGWPDELVEALVEALVEGGRQVLRFDHRDTGRSDCVDFAARPYTLADLAADTVAVLDGHDVAAAHVVGASLGGAVAQWLAVHRPERVRTLTAIMTGPMGHDPGPAWARALGGLDADPGARLRTIPGMGHGFFSPGLPRRVAGLVLEHTAEPGLMRSHEGVREA